ncbi:ABC transporter permease [Acinetobacter johnsonii]|uniref:ABC transporter permease n=1 Tax=Acinetobacter johnsonii TaxID=40214 RepID=A0A3R9FKD9_ACIJO|nr:ABC transporter permease [Acinetobacter johnsonii]MDH2048419.1 ABC transporter permease [Acinetobacter johnsonii]RSE18453.1 ABC transporter permease [Acinetobacter johnsonii]
MFTKLQNIYQLGCKELWSLWRDPAMLVLIIYTFTISVYTASTAVKDTLNMAPIAIVDEDHSTLSERISSAFYPPNFISKTTTLGTMDEGMDAGEFTFAVNIPANFQQDVLSGESAEIQVNVDATRMTQAMSGAGYIQQIIQSEVNEYVLRNREVTNLPIDLAIRSRFNPTLEKQWFMSVMQIINNVAMLSIILTGAALIREREHGTIEHLMVMPVTVFEIMMSKVWSMSLVVLIAVFVGLKVVIQGVLHVPIDGSLPLFFFGALLTLFATTSMGIYMATVSKSMPQFGLLMMLVLIPMQMLSGGSTPRESMPEIVQHVMMIAPTTHFVSLAQAILYRNAGFDVVWPSFVWLLGIAVVFFYISWKRFKDTIHTMA